MFRRFADDEAYFVDRLHYKHETFTPWILRIVRVFYLIHSIPFPWTRHFTGRIPWQFRHSMASRVISYNDNICFPSTIILHRLRTRHPIPSGMPSRPMCYNRLPPWWFFYRARNIWSSSSTRVRPRKSPQSLQFGCLAIGQEHRRFQGRFLFSCFGLTLHLLISSM